MIFKKLNFLIVISLIVFVVSCTQEPGVEDEVTTTSLPVAESDQTAGLSDDNFGLTGAELTSLADSVDLTDSERELLQNTTVYFDYDSSQVLEQFNELIAAHAKVLAAHGDVVLFLEGHADERGTREYNLALGDLRAVSVSKFFETLGVDSTRINSVSLGEEHPISQGHDEQSWKLNRRVEIIYDQ